MADPTAGPAADTEAAAARVARLVERLQLAPHPEGGHYRELFRSPQRVASAEGGAPAGPRRALTAILFLLGPGEASRWHKVDADETWHWHEGAPLELLMMDPAGGRFSSTRVGAASDGWQPLVVVPAGWWQAARPLGAYALVSCCVAPGFEFGGFAFLRDDPEAVRALLAIPAVPYRGAL